MQSFAEQTLKILMIRRGITAKQLAEGTGLALGTVHNLGAGLPSSSRVRGRVETFLDSPVWTQPEVFACRRMLGRLLDVDVMELSLADIRRAARTKGLLLRARTKWVAIAELTRRIQEFKVLVENEKQRKPETSQTK